MAEPNAPVEICDVHKTPKIRELQHVGDGNTKYSDPWCPLCKELEDKGVKPTVAEPMPKPGAPVASSQVLPVAAAKSSSGVA